MLNAVDLPYPRTEAPQLEIGVQIHDLEYPAGQR
jgi:hypothetical protein